MHIDIIMRFDLKVLTFCTKYDLGAVNKSSNYSYARFEDGQGHTFTQNHHENDLFKGFKRLFDISV